MQNSFFKIPYDESSLSDRLRQLSKGRIGFYSVGLYPISLAYNCVMQGNIDNLLLAPRQDRDLFGAFSSEALEKMDQKYLDKIRQMSIHIENGNFVTNSLPYLVNNCDLIVLSSNSNHIEEDLSEAVNLRNKFNKRHVLIASLVGSFCHDSCENKSYLLCQKEPNLAFFSGFHRHGALLNPSDSFTANFCHPEALTAMVGAKLMNSLSPNIQVSSGVHNLEGQYIKAAKNISSIFAGFCHSYHGSNPGLLPNLLTLLLNQCLDQAATVSMARHDLKDFSKEEIFPIKELGYGVQKIEASLLMNGNFKQVRDHTFAQLTAMVADVRGSMMLPVSGNPTRNFQAGQILAENMLLLNRCPFDIEEFIFWCEKKGLRLGSLEGLKSLKYWPQIKQSYSIEFKDSSMINLLYFSILGSQEIKNIIFQVMTETRELSSYCQVSTRPESSRDFANAISNLDNQDSIKLIVNSILRKKNQKDYLNNESIQSNTKVNSDFAHIKAIKIIEANL